MLDVIWDLAPWELEDPDSFDYSPYFARSEELGFGTETDFESDINDPKWLGDAAGEPTSTSRENELILPWDT
jgi:hypothetical protein